MAKAKAGKPRSVYKCGSCGHDEAKWLGRCPACGEWNTFVEEVERAEPPRVSSAGSTDGQAPVKLSEVAELDGSSRLGSGLGELDRVLGGGLVPGALVLLGGEPGIGKSTLLLQMLAGLARRATSVLYATGEESVAQTAMRARRIGAATDRISVVAETDVDRVIAHARAARPSVLAVDSIQTMYTASLESIPGSLAQVRECAGRLCAFAKSTAIPTVLVGHVTKDGALAGPKTLEHLVDAVLEIEAEGGSAYRIVRARKNRFGSTQEIGVFEMRGQGLVEVPNPSALLLAERPEGAPGSIVVASADGTRPLLVEVQALVAPAAAGFGRRTAAGVDSNRVALLLAVLAQRAGCDVLGSDVFVNVAGGLRLTEPAVDLGIACAIASSARGRAVDARTAVFGEVGLAGEIRAVAMVEARLAEARKLGFARVIMPTQNRSQLAPGVAKGLELVAVDRLSAAIAAL
ncbi:MAG: DNA repair protein RadA [Deltaproteobacteria bacterium]|nr:DNA repair protein RadA [Deltaproteobacteria bacterium]